MVQQARLVGGRAGRRRGDRAGRGRSAAGAPRLGAARHASASTTRAGALIADSARALDPADRAATRGRERIHAQAHPRSRALPRRRLAGRRFAKRSVRSRAACSCRRAGRRPRSAASTHPDQAAGQGTAPLPEVRAALDGHYGAELLSDAGPALGHALQRRCRSAAATASSAPRWCRSPRCASSRRSTTSGCASSRSSCSRSASLSRSGW